MIVKKVIYKKTLKNQMKLRDIKKYSKSIINKSMVQRVSEIVADIRILKNIQCTEINLKFSANVLC